jgi:hypothetical protein
MHIGDVANLGSGDNLCLTVCCARNFLIFLALAIALHLSYIY